MKDIKGQFAGLVDVKSIVTLLLVVVLAIVTLMQLPVPDLFSNAIMLILGFFFGKNLASGSADNGNATITAKSVDLGELIIDKTADTSNNAAAVAASTSQVTAGLSKE